jgi:carbonic anhydrase
MSVTDELLRHAADYARTFQPIASGPSPERRLAVVACMDARLDLFAMLGLRQGDAHIIRNAGGVVTDDAIRSLAISQRMLGTREIVLIHHTGCGLLTFTDDEFRQALEAETGVRPTWAAEAFPDVDADVRQSMARIHASPFVPHKDALRGFVFEVETGRLREIAGAAAKQPKA